MITVGTGKGISFENPYISEAEAQHIYALYGGVTYFPATVETFGNPALEVGDVVKTVDKDGNTCTVFVSELSLNLSGGFSETITSAGTGDTEIQFSTVSPTEKKIKQVYSNLQQAIAEASALINGAQGGIFQVTDSNGDGINDGWMLADNQDYTKAKKFIRANYEGIGLSTDGGLTYKNAITHEGIVADAITTGKLTAIEIENGAGFKVTADGQMECTNAQINGGNINLVDTNNGGGAFVVSSPDYKNAMICLSRGIEHSDDTGHYFVLATEHGQGLFFINASGAGIRFDSTDGSYKLRLTGGSAVAENGTWEAGSLESRKKNIEEYRENAKEIVNGHKIYSYLYNTDEDGAKKHYGFVIPASEDSAYKAPKECMSSGEGIDTYSMCAILWKAVQEMSAEIETLKERIDTLEEKANG